MVDRDRVVAAGQAVGVAEHAHVPREPRRAQGDRVALALAGDLDLVGRQAAVHGDRRADVVDVARVAEAAVDLEVAARRDARAEIEAHVVARLDQDVAAAGGGGWRADSGACLHHEVVARPGVVAH